MGRLRNLWYWVRCHTYNKYHIVDCRSKEWGYSWGYQEPSELILLSCFTLLKRFVEENEPYRNHFIWDDVGIDELKKHYSIDENPESLESVLKQHKRGQEIKALYLWWTKERKKEEEAVLDILSGYSFEWGFNDHPQENRDILTTYSEAKEKLEKRDQEMLHRLMDIRECLWT